MDTTEQLIFIVRFAGMDLDNTREGDWLNLQQDFADFHLTATAPTLLAPGVVIFDPRHDPEYEKYPKPKLKALQQELRVLLKVKAKPKGAAMTTPIKLDVAYSYLAGGSAFVFGRARDLFLQRVINLLLVPDENSWDRIRQCSVCKKFFVRVRRQVHCSPQCADRWNYEDRQREKAKKKRKRRRK